MTRKEIVYTYLQTHAIAYDEYDHPEGKTIEEAMRFDTIGNTYEFMSLY